MTPEPTDDLNSFSIPLSSLTEEFLIHVIYMEHVLIPLLSGLCLLLCLFSFLLTLGWIFPSMWIEKVITVF